MSIRPCFESIANPDRTPMTSDHDEKGLTKLFWAVRDGDPEQVISLLNSGADSNVRMIRPSDNKSPSSEGFTALHEAILNVASSKFKKTEENIPLQIVETLLEYQADPNISMNEIYPLSLLATWGKKIPENCSKCVISLLKRNANPNVFDNFGNHVLDTLLDCISKEAGLLLLERIMNSPGEKILSDRNLFLAAARIGSEKTLQHFLTQPNFDVNCRGRFQKTALILAIQYNHLECAQLLIESPIDIAHNDDESKDAILHTAESNLPISFLTQLLGKYFELEILSDGLIKQFFYLAAQSGQIEKVEYFLSMGLIPPESDEQKILERARAQSEKNHKNSSLQRNTRPSYESCEQKDPLIEALEKGDTALFQRLLNERGESKKVYPNGQTLLHLAAIYGKADHLKLLLDRGASLKTKNDEGQTPLHLAAKYGWAELVSLLLNHGADPSSIDNNGKGPLHLISGVNSSISTYELLLNHGAEIDKKDNEGQTPLYLATTKGNTNEVRLLLDRKANPDIANKHGQTPLHAAASTPGLAILELLMDRTTNLNRTDAKNKTPLHYAAASSYSEKVRQLLESGANPNLRDSEGKTPIFCAIEKKNIDHAEWLLKYRADLNLPDSKGRTPIFYAITSKGIDLFVLLLNYGARLDIEDKDSINPFFLSIQNDIPEIFEWILKNKTNKHVVLTQSRRLFNIAKKFNSRKCSEILHKYISDLKSTPLISELHPSISPSQS